MSADNSKVQASKGSSEPSKRQLERRSTEKGGNSNTMSADNSKVQASKDSSEPSKRESRQPERRPTGNGGSGRSRSRNRATVDVSKKSEEVQASKGSSEPSKRESRQPERRPTGNGGSGRSRSRNRATVDIPKKSEEVPKYLKTIKNLAGPEGENSIVKRHQSTSSSKAIPIPRRASTKVTVKSGRADVDLNPSDSSDPESVFGKMRNGKDGLEVDDSLGSRERNLKKKQEKKEREERKAKEPRSSNSTSTQPVVTKQFSKMLQDEKDRAQRRRKPEATEEPKVLSSREH
jgi:hypothetical protein